MQDVAEESFQKEVLDQQGVAVVDFYTDWCQPCKILSPIVEQLSKEMTHVSFFKVNAEEAAQLAVQYGIRSVPTLVIFKDGKVVEQIMGVQQKETLQKKIATFSS